MQRLCSGQRVDGAPAMTAKAKASAFEAHVTKAAKLAPVSDLAEALGSVVLVRSHAKAVAHIQRVVSAAPAARPTRRASPRRIGRAKAYTPTTAYNNSRSGTFRHYMIELIRAHRDTASAEAAHAVCSN